MCVRCSLKVCAQVACATTPVPGGVGPMTVAILLSNTFSQFKVSMPSALLSGANVLAQAKQQAK
jgi:5,10-methylene-tetrahydrofolate dehydrogenase/methenyl tetrahydrofolate cyclohydrolase